MIKITEAVLGKEISEECKITEVKIFKGGYKGSFWNDSFAGGRSGSKDR